MTESTKDAKQGVKQLQRAKRIAMVYDAVSKAKGPMSRAEIADEVGLSEGLVESTMKLVNRALYDNDEDREYDGMFVYRPRHGWSIARTWEDRSRWHLTLHKHATTRTSNLLAEADVALALWPGEAPQGLVEAYEQARFALDRATKYLASLEGTDDRTPAQSAQRPVKLVP